MFYQDDRMAKKSGLRLAFFCHLGNLLEMNAHSYIRWSSRKQSSGDSFLRQTDTARQIANAHGWELQDLPPEKGVSAWKGKNLSHKGILGQFIIRVEQGIVKTPCVLIIEKLDRFSRKDVDEVLPIFLSLLKLGVNVYSSIDTNYYSNELLKSDPLRVLMPMLIGFVAANQYSKTLSERVGAAKRRKIAAALSGENVYLDAATPTYIDWCNKSKTYTPNKKAEIVKRIFNEYLSGSSLNEITRSLNRDGIPTLYSGKVWNPTIVRQLLKSKAVTGQYKTRTKFFPVIVEEEDFNRVQGLLERNKIGSGKTSDYINIFRRLIKCKHCGSAMMLHKGGSLRYYRCRGHYYGKCEVRYMAQTTQVEEAFFALVLQSTPDEILGKDTGDQREQIKTLQETEIGIGKRIQELIQLSNLGIDEVTNELIRLRDQRTTIQTQINVVTSRIGGTSTQANLDTLKNLWKSGDIEKHDEKLDALPEVLQDPITRKKLSNIVPEIISSITLDLEEGRIQAEYTSGSKSKVASFD